MLRGSHHLATARRRCIPSWWSFPQVFLVVGTSFPGSCVLTHDAMDALDTVQIQLFYLANRVHPGTRRHLCASLWRLLAAVWMLNAGYSGGKRCIIANYVFLTRPLTSTLA